MFRHIPGGSPVGCPPPLRRSIDERGLSRPLIEVDLRQALGGLAPLHFAGSSPPLVGITDGSRALRHLQALRWAASRPRVHFRRDAPPPNAGMPALERGARRGRGGVPLGCPAELAAMQDLASDPGSEAAAHDLLERVLASPAGVGRAVVMVDLHGLTLRVHAGEVDGPQAVPRAELKAVPWVAEGARQATCPWLLIEHIYVGAGVVGCPKRRGGSGNGWPDWRSVAPHGRCPLRVRRVPAHLGSPGQAIGAAEWWGNRVADEAATAAAAALQVPPPPPSLGVSGGGDAAGPGGPQLRTRPGRRPHCGPQSASGPRGGAPLSAHRPVRPLAG